MTKRRTTKVFLRQAAVHPLGRLTLAGTLVDLHVTDPMPMRFWDTYAAIYVLAGRARFWDETGLSRPVRAGDLMLTFPGHGYHYHIDPHLEWSEFALHFQGPIFDLWREWRILDPGRPLYHLEPIAKWLTRFEGLVRLPSIRNANHLLKQVCQWQVLLAEILSHGGRRKQQPAHSLWLSQAMALLNEQPVDETPDWLALAERMGLSYDRFRKRFTQAAGTSPSRYVMARRLETACRLLEDRRLGLKEIAAACGFCDAFQFSKQFKKGLRMSPTEYRARKLRG
jgi:AraC-like DNA-binding protein